MNIYTNIHDLPELTIKSRMFPVDPDAIAILFQSPIRDQYDFIIGFRNRVGIASSILTSAQITNSLSIPITQAELDALSRAQQARSNAKEIPDWASQSEEDVLDWMTTNIGTPLSATIPPNPMTVQQIRAVLVTIVSVMTSMHTAIRAIARMLIAIRDHIWPNLQDV